MGSHEKNSKQTIYPNFAKRLGRVGIQYEKRLLSTKHERFETTLYVCILQNLVTQYCDLVGNGRGNKDLPLPIWGLKEEHIIRFPPDKNRILGVLLTQIRDVLSHPFGDKTRLIYESVSDDGEIVGYEFSKPGYFKLVIPVKNLKVLVFCLSRFLRSK